MGPRRQTWLLIGAFALLSACSPAAPEVEYLDWAMLTPTAADLLTEAPRRLLILAPHPDDEALIAAGVISAAVAQGISVYVAVATNGDVPGKSLGLERQRESVAAMARLGLPEDHVIFLGYGDQTLAPMWAGLRTDPAEVIVSAAGIRESYAEAGAAHASFHRGLTGTEATYRGENFVGDLAALIEQTATTEVYTTSAFDGHPDHRFLNFFLLRALRKVKGAGFRVPRVYETLVHCRVAGKSWAGEQFDAQAPWQIPAHVLEKQSARGTLTRFPVPEAMADPTFETNLKILTLRDYATQWGAKDFLQGFAKRDEIFWKLEKPRVK